MNLPAAEAFLPTLHHGTTEKKRTGISHIHKNNMSLLHQDECLGFDRENGDGDDGRKWEEVDGDGVSK